MSAAAASNLAAAECRAAAAAGRELGEVKVWAK